MATIIDKMKCPYCQHIFDVTEKQLGENSKFKCPKCRRYNAGSTKMVGGILIGEKPSEDWL